ncbi:MAG: sigma factor-like helix-turn-helix DNA-binding protein [Candidatus Izemoplasmataceae bacterium]|jgi:uncharacterized protein|uniref:sigma factor-like helix-turn-helix DNA-binding protein n=1 Tax=Liberiplasma polymorphum TaxID=3374570 RepID=UPI003774B98C
MSIELDKHVEIADLLSYYESLLTPKQLLIMRYYYLDNYSLSEIAELENVSRNAIFDQLKRTVKKLYNFEDNLKLKEKAHLRQTLINKLKNTKDQTLINQLLEALEKVE